MAKNRVGEIYATNNCGNIVLIEHQGLQVYKVQFEDGTIVSNVTFGRIQEKTVKNPNAKNIYNVACIGSGIKPKDNKRAYSHWINMIQRVYSSGYRERYPTYIGTSVCDEWLTFKNFVQWFNINYITNWVLDKDIKVVGNKVYSPDTCMFVPQEINTLFRKCSNSNTGLQGVTKSNNNRYFAKPCNIYLGVYDSEKEALKVTIDYKNKKLYGFIEQYKTLLPLKTIEILKGINFNIYYFQEK